MSRPLDPEVAAALAALAGPRQVPLEELSESAFDRLVFRSKESAAFSTGWKLRYHTLRSKGSDTGFPDRVLARERIIYVELKAMETKTRPRKPTPNQIEWLDGLARAAGEVYLWNPLDWDDIGMILGPRWRFIPWSEKQPPQLVRLGANWVPPSIWIPGVGRADTHPDYAELAGSPR